MADIKSGSDARLLIGHNQTQSPDWLISVSLHHCPLFCVTGLAMHVSVITFWCSGDLLLVTNYCCRSWIYSLHYEKLFYPSLSYPLQFVPSWFLIVWILSWCFIVLIRESARFYFDSPDPICDKDSICVVTVHSEQIPISQKSNSKIFHQKYVQK